MWLNRPQPSLDNLHVSNGCSVWNFYGGLLQKHLLVLEQVKTWLLESVLLRHKPRKLVKNVINLAVSLFSLSVKYATKIYLHDSGALVFEVSAIFKQISKPQFRSNVYVMFERTRVEICTDIFQILSLQLSIHKWECLFLTDTDHTLMKLITLQTQHSLNINYFSLHSLNIRHIEKCFR
jgi:hypothetical protein